MEKNKKQDPEPEKIVRKFGLNIEITEAEKRYRNENGPDDLKKINKEKLRCTVCARSLLTDLKKGNEPNVHVLLNVLMCRDCSAFYGDGNFSMDEDGDDKYCRWCGDGGTLYPCSSCTCAFCKKCIKRNLNPQDVKDVESDDWKCLVCKPNPLFECRTLCWFLQENYKKKEEEDNDISEKGKKNHNQKNEERRGSKMKSVDPLEVRSKRKKSTDSLKDTSDVQRKSNDSSVPHRQKRVRFFEEVEKPDEEKMKTSSRSGKSSRRINSKLENELTSLSNNASKKSNKIEKVVISDDNDEDIPESSPKKSKKQNSKKDLPKKATSSSDSIDKRPKRPLPKRKLTFFETPQTHLKVDKTSKSSSGKKKSAKTSDKAEASAVKRSQRFTKKISSDQEESDVLELSFNC